MMPAVFISHGSPMVALESDDYTDALRRFGESIPRPRAIVVVSAHWLEERLAVTAADHPPLIYDFGGFPPKLYRVVYPSPGEPALAREIAALSGAELEPARGLDHGVWVPLSRMFPRAQIPVVEVALPLEVDRVRALGAALAPLRERDVLLVGSGGVTHNLRRLDWVRKHAPAVDWAREFDEWAKARIEAFDLDGLARYAEAPSGRVAVPTSEHFDPLFFTLAAARPGERVHPIYEGFHHGSLSMRSFSIS